MKYLYALFFITIFYFKSHADEGLWLPYLLQKYTLEQMQQKGFKLSAEDIYSVNNASLKDAVPIFGGGCTSAVISQEGLLLTNHHCGFGEIRDLSSVDHDYLTNGFWATQRENELPCTGLEVSFLVRMEDVTERVLKNVNAKMSEKQRNLAIQTESNLIIDEAEKESHFEAIVKQFYNGNEYYLVVNEIFKDIRLVVTPPISIGKFGGDTDNWVWPRHTGDFSLFRIYAGKDNKPNDYSPSNIPYKPKKNLKISMKGIKENDFTMVLGYPGTTREYITSKAVKNIIEVEDFNKVMIRRAILDIYEKYMNKSHKIKLQYATEHASIANYWKKWLGEMEGLKKCGVVNKKQEFQNKIQKQLSVDSVKQKFGDKIIEEIELLNDQNSEYLLLEAYLDEAILRSKVISYGKMIAELLQNKSFDGKWKEEKIQNFNNFFKSINLDIEKEVFQTTTKLYFDNIPEKYQNKYIQDLFLKNKKDWDKTIGKFMSKSFFLKQKELIQIIQDGKFEKLSSEPAMLAFHDYVSAYKDSASAESQRIKGQLNNKQRIYMNLLKFIQKDRVFYPDANFTFRVGYGKVEGAKIKDGLRYDYYTSLEGIIEKEDTSVLDYKLMPKLKELFNKGDYGKYGFNGELRVCFLASNHTSGGNSGSPVLDANGNLIGLNFDRCWEGTMSDIYYDPDICRNIVLDIRYFLFVVDKVCNSSYLVDEMNLVYN